MTVLFGALVIFAFGLVLHAVVWKIALPARQTSTLLVLFLGTFLACLLTTSLRGIHGVPAWSGFWPTSAAQWLHAGVLFVSLTLAYIVTYSAIEEDSPSMLMVLTIDRAGTAGLQRSVLETMFHNDLPLLSRMENLVRDGWVETRGDSFAITRKGKRVNQVFLWYRNLTGVRGGG